MEVANKFFVFNYQLLLSQACLSCTILMELTLNRQNNKGNSKNEANHEPSSEELQGLVNLMLQI